MDTTSPFRMRSRATRVRLAGSFVARSISSPARLIRSAARRRSMNRRSATPPSRRPTTPTSSRAGRSGSCRSSSVQSYRSTALRNRSPMANAHSCPDRRGIRKQNAWCGVRDTRSSERTCCCSSRATRATMRSPAAWPSLWWRRLSVATPARPMAHHRLRRSTARNFSSCSTNRGKLMSLVHLEVWKLSLKSVCFRNASEEQGRGQSVILVLLGDRVAVIEEES